MRLTPLLVVLAGCATPSVPPDPAATRAGQERVCAEVVAEHVGLPVAEMAPEWQAAGADGADLVVVRHPGTRHTCEVDAELRVRALQHPGT